MPSILQRAEIASRDRFPAYSRVKEWRAECAQFLRYALASLAEARTHLRDGVHRGYFLESDCGLAFTWAGRCRVVLVSFLASQRRLIAADEAHARDARPRRKRRRTS